MQGADLSPGDGLMTKIKLRGLKLLEGGAQVVSSWPGGEDFLATGVCSPLALNKINLTFLTHVYPDAGEGCITSLCMEGTTGRAAASLIETHHKGSVAVDLQEGVSILSVFPHDQRPQVTGKLLLTLAEKDISLRGLTSSPSAVSAVVFSKHTEATIEGFFSGFEFPAYRSPSDWYAAYEGKEHLLRKIIASYQEKVIKIYDVVQRTDLDSWSLVLPPSGLSDLGEALTALGQSDAKMSFVVAVPSPENSLLFSFCFPSSRAAEVKHCLSRYLSTIPLACHPRVAALYIHGPHFGDRYGIAHTLVRALASGGVSLLALGCTVSSISVIIKEEDLAVAVQALEATFQRSNT